MISIYCNGVQLRGFSAVQATRALDQFCGVYSINAIPEDGAWLPTFPEDEIEIRSDDEVVVKGFNDECIPSFDTSGSKFMVRGREVSKDVVDCPPETINFENKKVDEIARIICAEFNVNFLGANGADVGAPLEKFSGDPGATGYEIMLAACRQRRVIPVSDGMGRVRLDGGRYESAEVDLKQGQNVLAASGNFSTKKRFKVYRVVASSDYSGKTFAEVTDDDVKRPRRWVMVDERWSTKECCEDRAMWEAKHQQAVANTVVVTVSGWRQKENGSLWKPGLIVRADLPAILGEGCAGEYLVNRVDYRFDVSSGAKAFLSLVDSNCYSPAPGFPVAKKNVQATKVKRNTWDSVRAQTGSKLR